MTNNAIEQHITIKLIGTFELFYFGNFPFNVFLGELC